MLIPTLNLSPPTQLSPLVTISFFSISVYLYLFIMFLKIPHISGIIWYLSFSVWLTSLSIIISRSIHSAAILFYGWVIFYCVCMYAYMSHLLYPLICSTRPRSPWDSLGKNTEWVAISSSNAWKWKVKVKSFSCVRLLATPWTTAYQAPPSMGFSRQE